MADASHPPTLSPGQLVGKRFSIEAHIRTDRLGVVYRATDSKTSRPICVRLTSSALFPTEEDVSRFRDLCRQGAALTSRSLEAIYGIGSVGGAQFLATEWIEGKTLLDYIDQREALGQKLSLQGAYNVIAHVCNALKRVHEKMPHGAVWPGNVWIADSGRVKTSGLGLASAVLQSVGPTALGGEAQPFIAPEIIEEGAVPTIASDVYSLGALLYFMLAGRPPGPNVMPVSMVHPEASPAPDSVILRCMERDPAMRFASADEARRVLHPIATGMQGRLDDTGSLEIEVVDAASMRPGSVPPPFSEESASIASALPRPPETGMGRYSEPSIEISLSAPPPFPSASPPGPPDLGATPAVPSLRSPFATPPPPPALPGQLGAPTVPREAQADPSVSAEDELAERLARLTANDAQRWMIVKGGLDHGPFSGLELVQQIIRGEIEQDQFLTNTDTGERGPLNGFNDLIPFLKQQQIYAQEAAHKAAIERSTKVEKRSTVAKLMIFGGLVIGVALAVTWFLATRSADEKRAGYEVSTSGRGVEYGEIENGQPSKARRGGKRRRGGGGASGGSGGSGGGSATYEEAMNQAVELGDVTQGGSQKQLSRAEVKTVMDRHINSMFTCVSQERARGGSLSQVSLDIAIMGDGKVSGVSVRAGSSAFKKCIQGKVSGIRFPTFPAPRMGASYRFSVD
ncbi:MAG: serine/threonine protein kinase [Myxococcales bacterium]|nr:serine/threonine protein kinase [Myxococcales bacterium]